LGPLATIVLLVTVAWATFLATLLAISMLILPLLEGVGYNAPASLARLGLSLLIFTLWLAWLFQISFYMCLRLSRGGGGAGE